MRSFKNRAGWSPAKGPEDADFIWSQYSKKVFFDLEHSRSKPRTLNHLGNNSCLVTKNGLYNSLRLHHATEATDLWRSVPLTFHLKSGTDDPERDRFQQAVAKDSADAQREREKGNVGGTVDGDSRRDGNSGGTTTNNTTTNNTTETKKTMQTSTPPPKYWIVKPASATNRGVGIRVFDNATEVLNLVDKYHSAKQKDEQQDGTTAATTTTTATTATTTTATATTATAATTPALPQGPHKGKKKGTPPTTTSTSIATAKKKRKGHREWVVQRYIHNPLLYKGRKFDIRVFVLLVSKGYGKRTECYVFNDGYLRTSSTKFSLDPKKLSNSLIHLTNDGKKAVGAVGWMGVVDVVVDA